MADGMTGSEDASRNLVHCLQAHRPLRLMQLPDELLGRIISGIENFDFKRQMGSLPKEKGPCSTSTC